MSCSLSRTAAGDDRSYPFGTKTGARRTYRFRADARRAGDVVGHPMTRLPGAVMVATMLGSGMAKCPQYPAFIGG